MSGCIDYTSGFWRRRTNISNTHLTRRGRGAGIFMACSCRTRFCGVSIAKTHSASCLTESLGGLWLLTDPQDTPDTHQIRPDRLPPTKKDNRRAPDGDRFPLVSTDGFSYIAGAPIENECF